MDMSPASWKYGGRMAENPEISYMSEGYRVQVHFSENGTLFQCIKNLAKRMLENNSESGLPE